MKDVYEVLRQKEADRLRIQSEIEALRIVIPLLDEKMNQTDLNGGRQAEESSTDANDAVETVNNGDKASGGGWWKLASH